MNKTFGIIGAACFAVAVALGYFVSFPSDTLVQIALAAFGMASLVLAAINKAKEADKFSWKTIVCVVLACIAGILCCLGGLADSIFATVSGAVIALVTIIFGVLNAKKE